MQLNVVQNSSRLQIRLILWRFPTKILNASSISSMHATSFSHLSPLFTDF